MIRFSGDSLRCIFILFLILTHYGCSSNKTVLKKTTSDLKSHLDTPHIHRSLHLPNNVNTLSLGLNKQFVTNNKYEDRDVHFPLGFSFVRNITKNLQSILGYFPTAFAYRIKENQKFKSSVFFGAGFISSSLMGFYILPYISLKNRYIFNDKHAAELSIGSNASRDYISSNKNQKTKHVPFLKIAHLYQVTRKSHSYFSILYKKEKYDTYTDYFIQTPETTALSKRHKSENYVYPFYASLTYLIFNETEASINLEYRKFGYKNGYEDKTIGIKLEWFFPTDG